MTLPFDNPSDAALIIPEIRSEVRAGTYSADILQLLPEAVRPGDRVLIIGAGLGVVSTMVARSEGVERIIAVEANTSLIPYLNRVHELNKVSEIETLNAVLAGGKTGRVPFFARRDLRTSSLVPHDRSWQQVMMVPFMDLNLILKEEQISLVICDIPVATAHLLALADLSQVERVLVGCGEDTGEAWESGGVCTLLDTLGFTSETNEAAVLFEHAVAGAARRSRQETEETGADLEDTDADSEDTDTDPEETDTDQEETGADLEAPGVEPEDTGAETDVAAARMDEAAEETGGTEHGPRDREPDGNARHGSGADQRIQTPRAGQAHDEDQQIASGGATSDAPLELQQEDRVPLVPDDSRSTRLWWLIALSLFMALPLIVIDEISGIRADHHASVVQEVGASWGGAQTLTGPFIVIPVGTGDGRIRERPLVMLPEKLQIDSELSAEIRDRGVFDVPVYRGRHTIRLAFDPSLEAGARAAGLLSEDEVVLWEDTALGLGITEPRTLHGSLVLNGGGTAAGFEPGAFNSAAGAAPMKGVHARIGDPRGHDGEWSFTLELDGSQQFMLTPAGGITEGSLHSDWPHPGFSGAYTPTRKVISETGFDAVWSIPQVAHSLPQVFRGTSPLRDLQAMAFGADLRQPMDIYQSAHRAAKYGLLLIAMTFGAIFLMEKVAPQRPHMAQYALVGAAQCVFFALLISLAEQIGFSRAYLLGSAATIALLTVYAWFALRMGPRSGWLTAALGLLYGVVYMILSSEGQALLMGAVLAFVMVAAVMWGTRNEDWGKTFASKRAKPPAKGPED